MIPSKWQAAIVGVTLFNEGCTHSSALSLQTSLHGGQADVHSGARSPSDCEIHATWTQADMETTHPTFLQTSNNNNNKKDEVASFL